MDPIPDRQQARATFPSVASKLAIKAMDGQESKNRSKISLLKHNVCNPMSLGPCPDCPPSPLSASVAWPFITNKAGSRVKEARDRSAQQPPFRENCEGSKRGDDLPVALSITHSLHSYIHTFTHPCISRPLLLRRSTPILTTLVIAVLIATDRPG